MVPSVVPFVGFNHSDCTGTPALLPNYRVIPLRRGEIPAVCSPNLATGQIGEQVGVTTDLVGVTSDLVGMTTDLVSIETLVTEGAPRKESQARRPLDILQNPIVTPHQHLPPPLPVLHHQRSRNRYFFHSRNMSAWLPRGCLCTSSFHLYCTAC